SDKSRVVTQARFILQADRHRIAAAAMALSEFATGGGMSVVAAILLLAVLAVCFVAQVLSLPGNWLIVGAAALYVLLTPPDAGRAFGWNVVIALVLLALVGEAVELAASALGVSKVGGSRRGALLAIVGSIVGSLLGFVVGLPIPLVGSLVSAVVFGGLGAL